MYGPLGPRRLRYLKKCAPGRVSSWSYLENLISDVPTFHYDSDRTWMDVRHGQSDSVLPIFYTGESGIGPYLLGVYSQTKLDPVTVKTGPLEPMQEQGQPSFLTSWVSKVTRSLIRMFLAHLVRDKIRGEVSATLTYVSPLH